MLTIEQLLGKDFDGNPSEDFSEVVLDGLDDPRHRDRVPALIEILHSADSAAVDRFLSCIALTTWAVAEGLTAVIDACENPANAPWEGVSIDRMYSVDNTFAQLAMAVRTSHWLAEENGTTTLRADAVCALIDAADTVYFDGQLEAVVKSSFSAEVASRVRAVVHKGLARLHAGEEPRWDLATQLVDLASGLAGKADKDAVDLTIDLVTQSPHLRLLRHAADLLSRTDPSVSADLADLILTFGGAELQLIVAAAQERRKAV